MSQDAHSDPAVVSWGEPDDAGPAPARRPGGLAALRRDRRVVLAVAGLAAVALLASLVDDWQVTTIRPDPSEVGDQTQQITAGLGQLGVWGAAYLVGVVLAVAGATVVLFGPAAGRAHVRVATLGGCGTLVALIGAAWSDLGRRSAPFNGLFYIDGPTITLEHGRGISVGLVGVVLLGVALLLVEGRPAAARDPEAADAEAPAAPEDDHARWLPRRAEPDERPEEPFDLTVAPAAPFAAPPDPRARP
ncbi:hypothetical protein [Rhizomonospora bruguierae]|uniref:hypothetical protein n=1 Tax=Rhizomonospora bruguierae TaxID=1581705 RepID=UPI001BCE5BD7|nr:hypothetical protein [Micromonospora sp. NBRC 107566]